MHSIDDLRSTEQEKDGEFYVKEGFELYWDSGDDHGFGFERQCSCG
jgi:hypothetical protein